MPFKSRATLSCSAKGKFSRLIRAAEHGFLEFNIGDVAAVLIKPKGNVGVLSEVARHANGGRGFVEPDAL